MSGPLFLCVMRYVLLFVVFVFIHLNLFVTCMRHGLFLLLCWMSVSFRWMSIHFVLFAPKDGFGFVLLFASQFGDCVLLFVVVFL